MISFSYESIVKVISITLTFRIIITHLELFPSALSFHAFYCIRSQSVQDGNAAEKPTESPVMFRRKDSFKNKKVDEDPKKDEGKKTVPFKKQQSLDPQAGKNIETPVPTTKRTSTVFGELYL